MIGGDFNLITSLGEKKGGRRCLEDECNLFKDIIDDLGMVDITPGRNGFPGITNEQETDILLPDLTGS